MFSDHIGLPILLGREDVIVQKIKELGFNQSDFEIVDPRMSDRCEEYTKVFYELRQRKGITQKQAKLTAELFDKLDEKFPHMRELFL